MGHEIVYCSGCQTRLSGTDFEKGKAFRVRDSCLCAACAKKALPTLPPEERKKILGGSEAPKAGSTSRLKPAPAAAAPSPGSTAKMRTAPPRPPAPRDEEEPEAAEEPSPLRKKAGLIAGVGGGVLLLVLLLVFAFSGGKSAEELGTASPPPPGPDPGAGAPAPGPKDGEAALKKAQDFCRANPTDFDGRIRAWEEAVRDSQGTPQQDQARKELEVIRAQQQTALDNGWTTLERDLHLLVEREQYGSALEVLKRSATLFSSRAWTERVDGKAGELRERAAALFPLVKKSAAEARQRGDAATVEALRRRVARWGMEEYCKEFETAMASAAPPPAPAPEPGPAPPPAPAPEPAPGPAPEPPAPPLSRDAAAYLDRWEKAVKFFAAREYTAAASEIANASRLVEEAGVRAEAVADLDRMNLLDTSCAAARKVLAEAAAGRSLALTYRDDLGEPRRFEGKVLRSRPYRVLLKAEEEVATVDFGEVTGPSLAEAFLSRPEKKPETDARAAALLCLADGDAEAARKYVPGPGEAVPRKYWDLARKIAEERARTDSDAARREAEARKVFHEASREIALPARTWESLQKIDSLLNNFGETAFVRRNRASLTGLKEAGKEYFFLPSDLAASGTFRAAKSAKGLEALIVMESVEGIRGKDNYVQFEFSALPDTAYRCWVLMGGCCKDNFNFYQQATELTGPDPRNPRQEAPMEPDGPFAAPVKVSIRYLKSSHASHGGEMEPTRFEWVEVPLPKYASPGPKTVRLLAEIKGAAVAQVLVTSLRGDVPKDAELEELAKARAEAIAAGLTGKRPTGVILREWWTGVKGNDPGDLRGKLDQKPSGSDLLESFDAPTNWADEYGTRIRGYVHPPKTGAYVFWIASDNGSELWLSTDEKPANKRKIASVSQHTGHNEWGKEPGQQSEPVELVAGRRYYVEVLHKEGNGGDNVSVGWQLPGGGQERPIPGKRLSDK